MIKPLFAGPIELNAGELLIFLAITLAFVAFIICIISSVYSFATMLIRRLFGYQMRSKDFAISMMVCAPIFFIAFLADWFAAKAQGITFWYYVQKDFGLPTDNMERYNFTYIILASLFLLITPFVITNILINKSKKSIAPSSSKSSGLSSWNLE